MPKKARKTFTLDQEVVEKFEDFCIKNACSQSKIANMLLQAFCKKEMKIFKKI